MLSASCGIEGARVIAYKPLLDRALELAAHRPRARASCFQRPQAEAALVAGRDLDWAERWPPARAGRPVPVAATDPLYILYTSGTTGRPKGVVRDNGGHAVALRWSMANVYAAQPGDVFWAASDVGWVVGHSYIVYAPLLAGCTTVMYEGKPVGTPDPGAFWRVIADHGVRTLFTAPTAFRAIRKEDPDGRARRPPRPRRVSSRSSSPASGSTPTRILGDASMLGAAGDRPLVADRDRLADRRQLPRHRAPARQARLADAAGARLRRAHPATATARSPARARRARSPSGCRCRRDAADAVGRRRPLPCRAT